MSYVAGSWLPPSPVVCADTVAAENTSQAITIVGTESRRESDEMVAASDWVSPASARRANKRSNNPAMNPHQAAGPQGPNGAGNTTARMAITSNSKITRRKRAWLSQPPNAMHARNNAQLATSQMSRRYNWKECGVGEVT